MRTMTVSTFAFLALAVASCSSYFDGTNLYMDFAQLPVLNKLRDVDTAACSTYTDEATCTMSGAPPIGHNGCTWQPSYVCSGTLASGGDCSTITSQSTCEAPASAGCSWGADPDPDHDVCSGTQTVGLCADEAYLQLEPSQASPDEYNVWAMINGGPVRLARFTVRECAFSLTDTDIKKAITTVSFQRDTTFGYPDKASGSNIFGAVDGVFGGVPVGNAYMTTDVRLDGATEMFVTRETTAAVDANPSLPPTVDNLITKASLSRNADVFSGTFVKLAPLTVSGYVTAILVNRTSAW